MREFKIKVKELNGELKVGPAELRRYLERFYEEITVTEVTPQESADPIALPGSRVGSRQAIPARREP